MKPSTRFIIVLLWSLGTYAFGGSMTWATDSRFDMVAISDPYIRAMPASAKVTSGYLIIHNNGMTADRLLKMHSTAAARIEIHEMRMDGDVMRMRTLPNGLELPAGKTISLTPGGYHLMIFEPDFPLIAGGHFQMELHFARAGRLDVTFDIRDVDSTRKNPHDSAHDHHHGH